MIGENTPPGRHWTPAFRTGEKTAQNTLEEQTLKVIAYTLVSGFLQGLKKS